VYDAAVVSKVAGAPGKSVLPGDVAARPLPATATEPFRIALVDDDPLVRQALVRVLQARDVAVVAFASAEDLLADSAWRDFSCLLLDLHLPGMSGPELARQAAAAGVETPTIFISGAPAASISWEMTALGSDAVVLIKPIDAELLRDTVQCACAAARSRPSGTA